jgi:hypothetical protein
MASLDIFVAFWKGLTKRSGLKLTDKLLVGNIDTEKSQYIDVQDLPFSSQSDFNDAVSGLQATGEALQTAINSEAATRQTDDETLQKAVDLAGPDVLVASSMQDMYEKLNDSAWWLNGHPMTAKIMIRQIRISPGSGWVFTLLVVRSNLITQYLFGPAKLNEDNTFVDGSTYFESYILKRTITGSDGAGQWHYVDRPDFFNIDAYKPLASGYYTAADARGAIPSSMRKRGMVITYQTGTNAWKTEQAKGTSGWTEDANWQSVGGIEEAPQDGKIYGRRNGAWIEIGTEAPTTDIEFEITLPDDATEIPDLVRMSSPSGHGQAVIDWGDGSTETVTVPDGVLQDSVMSDGSVYAWVEGVPFGHTYASAGIYTVKITSYASVDAICFSTLQEPEGGEWAASPVAKPLITKMNKFKSESLQSLYYTFAGLVNMQMDEDFVLETPQVNNISFMMWDCGNNLADFNLPAGLLSRITLPQTCYRTFMNSGTRFIPEGFMNTLTKLITAFEMFRSCHKLGHGWYNDPLSNSGTIDFIPVSLFHKCTKLENITGIFNDISTDGWFGTGPYNYGFKPVVRKDLFKNTKIVTADFAFYKWNRANLEPDVFYWIKNTLVSLEGIFFEWNEARNALSYGQTNPGTTMDLAEVFPDSEYLLIRNLINAFAPSPVGEGKESFNADLSPIEIPWVKLDLAAFVAKFPNCKAGSAFGDRDGRTGAFRNLENNCDNWDTVEAIDGGVWVN